MAKFLKDFPSGPLDRYRKLASFDWKKLKIFLDTEDIIEYEYNLHNEFKSNPVFQHPLQTPSFSELRKNTLARMFAMRKIEDLGTDALLQNLRRIPCCSALMINFDASAYIKLTLTFGMCINVLQTMGTEKHFDLIEKALNGEIIICYCLTEIGHGSNTKGMQTTATYDPSTKEFILHSPNFEAAKCWAGLLGQTATHAIVYAQLITKGVHNGLHAFIVKIRDPESFTPCPGVTVGDMGEKIGLNGLDNGFVMFNEYRISKDCLLNKMGDVKDEGTYVTPFRDPNKRHGASLNALSMGRINITNLCQAYLTKAVTIAVRYAAVRKQFGPGDEEIPVLEYQTHQYRLLPYLSASFALKLFSLYIMDVQYKFAINSVLGKDKDEMADLGLEMHAISCTSKPLAGWIARDGIQECREACAGHGYLKAAGLGEVKNNHDANLTYEGENHVLIQQTSNWLLKYWPLILKGEKFSTPLNSINFLNNAQEILKNAKFTWTTAEEISKPENIFVCYEWLVCYLLKHTHDKLQNHFKMGLDVFTARNENQIFYAKNLSIAYLQYFIIRRFYETVKEAQEPEIHNVLLKLFSLFSVWSLEKNLVTFYQGGFISGAFPTEIIQKAVLKLCKDIKDDSVALVDAIAPPDYVLNSALGASDGLVYKHLEASMIQAPNALTKPEWWKDIVEFRSKL